MLIIEACALNHLYYVIIQKMMSPRESEEGIMISFITPRKVSVRELI